MQAFAISVVLMSSACGQDAVIPPGPSVQSSPAPVGRIDSEPCPTPYVVSFNAERYDSGKGDRHVFPLSSRRSATSGQR